MPDVRLIDANVVISYIDDCIAESRDEREDAKSRGNDCEVNYNAGEIQMARRIKRQINLGTPTINAVPTVYSSWDDPWPYRTGGICRNCETHAVRKYKHCPECGAKMKRVN